MAENRHGDKTKQKLLIDLSIFEKEHRGGKDEVAYNLLRGFSKLGYVSQILCVGRQELEEIVHRIDPAYTFLPLERKHYTGKIRMLLSPIPDFFYGIRVRRAAREQKCGRILFTNKLSPFVRMPVKTYLIPHDILPVKVARESRKLRLNTRGHAFLIRINFRFVDKIIAISDYDREEMIRCLPRYQDKIIRIYDPIQFKSAKPSSERTNITALNIQHNHKNTVTLVKAYARIAPEIRENLILVGRKNFHPEVEEEINRVIRENRLDKRVTFTGFVPEDELREIIASTRIYVNPSIFEGFGMTAVEMMESRIPTLVANNTAQKETTLGMCRYYEPATDDAALAEAILEEINHPTPEAELEKISESVRNKYDYVRIAQEYWNEIMRSD